MFSGLVSWMALEFQKVGEPARTASRSSRPSRAVWVALDSIDPAFVGRRLAPLLKEDELEGNEALRLWDQLLPDVLQVPVYRESFRIELANADPEEVLSVLERVTALQSLCHALVRRGASPRSQPRELLPEKYREEIMKVYGPRYHSLFDTGKIIQQQDPDPDLLVDRRGVQSSAFYYENGGQFRLGNVLQDGGYRPERALDAALGLKVEKGPELPTKWTYETDFRGEARHLRSSDFALGIYCSEPKLHAARIERFPSL